MSFILDALKKSEAERQRQAGPTLLDVRVLPPAPRWPAWSVAMGVLLLVNLGVLGWFLSRRPAPATGIATVVSPHNIPAPAGTPAAAPVPAATGSATPPGASAAAGQPTAATVSARPTAPLGTSDTAAADSGAHGNDTGADTNPADEQPALSRAEALAASSNGHVRIAADDDSLPDYSDLAGTVPLLRLDLHVYSGNPADRYALINMRKEREGDVLPEGARVVRISPQGVVLDYQGQRFLLRKQ